nr:MAG TPA: hypothetical protein [Caudoviricetes sp.]
MYRSYNLGFYQKGGVTKTVAQQWKEKTGLEWSEAKRLGFTDGSYEGNIKLASQLGTDKFNGQLTSKIINPDSNKKIISDIVGRRNGVQGQSISTGSQKVITQGMPAKKSNKLLPSVEELVASVAAGPAPHLINLAQNKNTSKYLPSVEEMVASVAAGPAPHLGKVMQNKEVSKQLPNVKELATALAAGPALIATHLLSNKSPKSNKTGNGGAKGGSVMLPIPVNVGAYKKYRDGGQVTIEELFGY